jgi:hypothetical protein
MRLKMQNEEIREKRRQHEMKLHGWMTIMSNLRFLSQFKAFAEVSFVSTRFEHLDCSSNTER